MSIKYKDGGKQLMERLKDKGYTSYKLRTCGLIGEAAMTKIRNDVMVSLDIINLICTLLDCDLFDVLEYEKDDKTLEIIRTKITK